MPSQDERSCPDDSRRARIRRPRIRRPRIRRLRVRRLRVRRLRRRRPRGHRRRRSRPRGCRPQGRKAPPYGTGGPACRSTQGAAAWFVLGGVFGYLRAPHRGPNSAGSPHRAQASTRSPPGEPEEPEPTRASSLWVAVPPGLSLGLLDPQASPGSVKQGWPTRPIASLLSRPKLSEPTAATRRHLAHSSAATSGASSGSPFTSYAAARRQRT